MSNPDVFEQVPLLLKQLIVTIEHVNRFLEPSTDNTGESLTADGSLTIFKLRLVAIIILTIIL